MRSLPDGTLLFLGRNDDQVKIRGYRVELGEVEVTLAGHAGVDAVAVAVREQAGLKRLVAYVVPAGDRKDFVNELRELARRRLPDYMLPAAYVVLDKLPLTRTGKVDRAALPEPDAADTCLEESFIPPRNETEKAIARIWEDLLGVRPVGVGHDFFELGGHSLLATRLIAHVEKRLGQRIALMDFFQTPTIEGVASLLREPSPAAAPIRRPAAHAAGSRSPLLLVHPLPIFRPLVRRLRSEHPVEFLNMPLVRQLPADHTIDDLLEPMLAKLLREYEEPYCLGGWCRYGLMAYELACRLRARGKRVDVVVLLDVLGPGTQRTLPKRYARRMWYFNLRVQWSYHLACLRQLRLPEATAYLAERVGLSITYLSKVLAWKLRPKRSGGGRAPQLSAEFTPNLKGWVPGSFDGRVILVKAQDAFPITGDDEESWGWNKLTESPVEVAPVGGNHLTMFLEPNAGRLASELAERLR